MRGRIAELPRPSVPERRYVVGTAIWAFGVIALTVGVTWIGGTWDNVLRWAIILGGIAVLALAVAYDRRRTRQAAGTVRIERRPVAIAVIVGVVLGIAQTAPMMELPRYFQMVLGYGPLFAVAALAPLFGALVLAGPVAGFLLARYAPRTLVGIGAIVVGLGSLLLALISTPSAGYLWFIVPCALVGAGFVVATTVRTAIIFASVPRGMPATAAALNESSIAVGARIGIVLVTAVVAQVALATYTASVAGLPDAEAQQAIDAFRDVLAVVGTPSFSQVASAVDPASVAPYIDAYAAGVQAALAMGGLVAVIGGLLPGSRSAAVTRSRPCGSFATSARRPLPAEARTTSAASRRPASVSLEREPHPPHPRAGHVSPAAPRSAPPRWRPRMPRGRAR